MVPYFFSDLAGWGSLEYVGGAAEWDEEIVNGSPGDREEGSSFVLAEATVLKTGRTLAYVSVDVKREQDGVLVAQGRMTKFMG